MPPRSFAKKNKTGEKQLCRSLGPEQIAIHKLEFRSLQAIFMGDSIPGNLSGRCSFFSRLLVGYRENCPSPAPLPVPKTSQSDECCDNQVIIITISQSSKPKTSCYNHLGSQTSEALRSRSASLRSLARREVHQHPRQGPHLRNSESAVPKRIRRNWCFFFEGTGFVARLKGSRKGKWAALKEDTPEQLPIACAKGCAWSPRRTHLLEPIERVSHRWSTYPMQGIDKYLAVSYSHALHGFGPSPRKDIIF